ncbi:MAG: translocation/assembly module TamB domain-containing protein [Myxococcota bacterium]|nr:translocation/assembly module TamB domain-containing protein [Myxococcota bacterium]
MIGRRRAWRILRAILLVLVLMLVSLWAVVESGRFARWLADRVEVMIEEATGEEAVVGRLVLHPWRGRVDVEGVVLSHVGEVRSETVVAVERVSVDLVLAGREVRIGRLEVQSPVVRLHVDEDGMREFRGWKSTGRRPHRFPWDELVVRDGSVHVVGDGLGVHLEGLNLVPGQRGDSTAIIDVGAVGLRLGEVEQLASGVHLPRVTLAPDRIILPEVEVGFSDARVSGAFAARVDGEIASDLSLHVLLPLFDTWLPPSLALRGTAHVDVTVQGTKDAPEVSGAVLSEGARLVLHPDGESPWPIELGTIVGLWEMEDRKRLRLSEGEVRLDQGSVRLDSLIDLDNRTLELTAEAEELGLGEVLRAVGLVRAPLDAEMDGEVQLSGSLSPLALTGPLDLVGIDFEIGADPLIAIPGIRLHGELQVDKSGVSLHEGRLASRRSRVSLDLDYPIATTESVELQFEANPLALSELSPLAGLGLSGDSWIKGRVFGQPRDLQLSGWGSVRNLEIFERSVAERLETRITGQLFTDLGFPEFWGKLGDTEFLGSLDVGFQGGAHLNLDLDVEQGQVSDLVSIWRDLPGLDGLASGHLSMEGPVRALDGQMSLTLQDMEILGEPFPEGSLQAWWDSGHLTLDELMVWRKAEEGRGSETLLVRGSLDTEEALQLDVIGTGFRLERTAWVERQQVELRGVAALDLRVGGTLSRPAPKGRLAVRETWLNGRKFGDSTLFVDTVGEKLHLEGQVAGSGIRMQGELNPWERSSYTFDARLEDFPAHIFYPLAADGRRVRAKMSGSVSAQGSFEADAEPPLVQGRLDALELGWGRHRLQALETWTFLKDVEGWEFDNVGLEGGETRFSMAGEKNVEGEIRIQGEGTVELDLLRAMVPGLERAEGVANVDLLVEGFPGELKPSIDAQVDEAVLRGVWFPASLEQAHVALHATPVGYEIVQARGTIGGGQALLHGRIEALDWVPTRYQLEGRLEDGVVQMFEFLPPIRGDAQFTFDGPVGDLLLSGDVQVAEMRFSERIDWEDWVLEVSDERLIGATEEKGEDWFAFDVELTAEDSIEVHNNVASLEASGELRIVGDTERPGMVGDLRARPGGRAFLNEREFEVVRGEVRFIDPYSFDPELDIALRTDVEDREQEVVVDYRIHGPWSGWTTETSSDPPLSQADINALLLFGMTRDELERYGGLEVALAAEGGDLLAPRIGSLVEKVGEGIFQVEIIDTLRPDRLDLVTGVSERGSDAVSSDLRLQAEKDVEMLGLEGALIFEQNLNRPSDRYLGLEERLAQKLYLRGFWASEVDGRTLPVGGAYGLDVSLRWEFD